MNYKKIMHGRCGRGGLFCPCCNHYKGKDKAKLSRLTRRTIKQLDRGEM